MAARTLSLLSSLRRSRDERSRHKRIRLLQRPLDFSTMGSKKLLALHDLLLFELAHQDNQRIGRLAEVRLRELIEFIEARVIRDPDFLIGSGIAGTARVDSFSRELLQIISTRLGQQIELDWNADGTCGPELDEFLRESLLTTEKDAVLYDKSTTKALIEKLLSTSNATGISWLLKRIDPLLQDPKLKDRVVSSLQIWIRWRLSKDSWSRTFLRFPKRLKQRAKFPQKARLSHSDSAELLDLCRGILAARGKETDTVVYSSPARVTLHHFDQAVDVALFELNPDRRLPIESYVGFVAARNRVPVAYGGAWILGYRAEVGLNIFEEFRGGNSRGIFAAVLSVYQRRYAVKSFLVHPSQFGDDNEEALSSGAFWFYYRFGFRPDDQALHKFAEIEAQKRAKNPRYRCPRRAMKRLSKRQLVLALGDKEQTSDKELVTQEIGYLLFSKIAERFGGDKVKAQAQAHKLWNQLGGRRSPAPEIALLLCLIPNLAKWSQRERRDLKNLLALKVAKSERPFVLAVQAHSLFRAELKACLRALTT